jgi:hypothetical protein
VATDFDRGHRSLKAGGYWCALLAEHRPDAELAARSEVFRRWPSSSTAQQRPAAGADALAACQMLGANVMRVTPIRQIAAPARS